MPLNKVCTTPVLYKEIIANRTNQAYIRNFRTKYKDATMTKSYSGKSNDIFDFALRLAYNHNTEEAVMERYKLTPVSKNFDYFDPCADPFAPDFYKKTNGVTTFIEMKRFASIEQLEETIADVNVGKFKGFHRLIDHGADYIIAVINCSGKNPAQLLGDYHCIVKKDQENFFYIAKIYEI